jgi:hypothetical protein
METAIMLEDGSLGDLSCERDVMWLFDHGGEQNEITYIRTECAILVGSIIGHYP